MQSPLYRLNQIVCAWKCFFWGRSGTFGSSAIAVQHQSVSENGWSQATSFVGSTNHVQSLGVKGPSRLLKMTMTCAMVQTWNIYPYIYICNIYIYVIYNYIIIYAYTIILRVINPLIVSYSDLYTYYMNSHSAMTWLVPVDPKDPTWHAHIPRLATSGWPNGPVLWSRMAVDNHQLIDCKQYKCALYI